jgi:endonuclease YncB( thermonuclease family)
MAIWANENASNMKSQFAHLRHRGVPTPPRASRRIAVFLAAALSLLFLAAGASAGCPVDGGERAMVSSVTDRGEIALADGRVARLAGLDIPDSTRGELQNGASARAWLASHLVGRAVALRILAARTDRWGRLLADIENPDSAGGRAESIALGLLTVGLPRVRPESEAKDCLNERLAAENSARSDGLGLWTDPYYGVVEAADLDELRQRDGQFAIVEGVVLRVGLGRDRTWLDFGRRGGFSAVVALRQAKAFERAGLLLSALAGAKIRVRGAMDNRFGLRMAISSPDQIERLSQSVGTSEAEPDK